MYYIHRVDFELSHSYWWADKKRWTTSADFATRFDSESEANKAAKDIPATDGYEICHTEN